MQLFNKAAQVFYFVLGFILFFYLSAIGLFCVKINNKKTIQHFFPNIPQKPSLLSRTFKAIDSEKNLDLLFIGSSHCYRAFDPNVFKANNINVFNLGSSSQTPINSYHLLKKYIHKTKAVVLEVYPVTICNSGNESFLEMVGAVNSYAELMQQALASKAFFDFQLLALKPIIDFQLKELKPNSCVYRKGYAVVPDSAINRKVIYDTLVLDTAFLKLQLTFINKIVDLCKENNKQLILTYAPLPAQLVLKNEAAVAKEINAIVIKNKIPYINMSRNHQLNDGFHFYDDDHLNATGVVLYNQAFINELKHWPFFNYITKK